MKPEQSISLADCVRHLERINHNVFQLKSGMAQIIRLAESGDVAGIREVIKVFAIKETLFALTPDKI